MAELGFEPGSLTLNHDTVQLALYIGGRHYYPFSISPQGEVWLSLIQKQGPQTYCLQELGRKHEWVKQTGVRQEGLVRTVVNWRAQGLLQPLTLAAPPLQKGVTKSKCRLRVDFLTEVTSLNF